MNLLHIRVDRKTAKGWPVVFDLAADGASLPEQREVFLQFDPAALIAFRVQPRLYGIALGQALFADPQARDFFRGARARRDGPLHVLLSVVDEALQSLRWGRLCAPLEVPGDAQWDHVALNARTPFTLYLPARTDQRFPPIVRADLKALVLVANPSDSQAWGLKPFDSAGAVQVARTALQPVPAEVLARVDSPDDKPTLNALSRRLAGGSYPLLHLVCHGRQRPDGEATLYLEDEEGKADPVPAGRFLEQLGRQHGSGYGLPRLVFLSSCQSAVPGAGEVYGNLAERLVRELGVPGVLAMTEDVPVDLAADLVRTFYPRLLDHGEVDRAMPEACAALAASKKHDLLVPVLYSRLRDQRLFNESGRPPTVPEIHKGLEAGARLLQQRAPVVLPQWEEHARVIREALAENPGDLSKRVRKERDKALRVAREELDAICEESLDVRFDAIALGARPRRYDGRCPFRGLLAFTLSEAEFFFGRRALVRRLRKRLTKDNFLAVLGASGSGKSSLVLAGLLPALQVGPEEFAYIRPGSDPRGALATALANRKQPAKVLVVDQFEELFTQSQDAQSRRQFVDQLLVLREQLPVVITMRADFWGECAAYPALKRLMQKRQELIGAMTPRQLRKAVDEQARTVGLEFDPGLLDRILEEVTGEPGAMPLLQYALLKLWERRHGRWLKADEYTALGGVKTALARSADAFYDGLSDPESRDLVRDIFLRLTRIEANVAAGEEVRDTRHRVPLSELTGGSAKARLLVDQLAGARLIVKSAEEGEAEVEVAHEALIRHWPLLRDWVDRDRKSHVIRQEVSNAAREWNQNHRDHGFLIHHGSRLQAVQAEVREQRITLNSLESEYVSACQERMEPQRTPARALEPGDDHRNHLDMVGWGVVFAHDADPAIREALRPLLDHRRAQCSRGDAAYYHEFIGVTGYRRGDTKPVFLRRQGVGGYGSAPPDQIPHHILLVGDPDTIPYEFQYQLDVEYSVGRLYFDDLAAYRNYAASVLQAETGHSARPKRAVFFGVRSPDDLATEVSSQELIDPLHRYLANRFPDWAVHRIAPEQTTKEQLRQLFCGEMAPALLFSAAQSVSFPPGDERQERHQGAIICRDWPGPEQWKASIPNRFYFSADDIPDRLSLAGSILYLWGCYSAGTPRHDDFQVSRQSSSLILAEKSFVSALAQRVLGHPNGGPLAIIGRVERCWFYSFRDEGGLYNLGIFQECLTRLLRGYCAGLCLEPFNRRYGELASELSAEMHQASQGKQLDKHAMSALRMTTTDARNYVIVGDPAVRFQFPSP